MSDKEEAVWGFVLHLRELWESEIQLAQDEVARSGLDRERYYVYTSKMHMASAFLEDLKEIQMLVQVDE